MYTPISPRYVCGLFVLVVASSLGCTSNTAVAPAAPNPFLSADRVPPPGGAGGVAPPAAAAPYYQGAPTTFAPGSVAPPAPGVAPAPQAAPLSPPPGSAAPVYGTPPLGAASPPIGPIAATGDRVAIPADRGSLRFASESAPGPASVGAPVQRSDQQLLAANPTPTRPPATASGWIAGSAPIRPPATGVAASGSRVRLPSGQVTREPISIAALDRTAGSVPIAPLEPAPLPSGPSQPGEPAPLRIASPSTTGWR